MANIISLLTSKGKDCIIVDNYKYRKIKVLCNGCISWRCCVKGCPCRVRTNGSATVITIVTRNHSGHKKLTDSQVELQVASSTCKTKGTAELSVKPAVLIRGNLSTTENRNLQHEDMGKIRQAVYRARRKLLPKAPRTVEEVFEQLSVKSFPTNRKEEFCHVYEDMVILTCKTNLDFLVKHGDIVLGDGTFYCSPTHFHQLYTIHAFYNHTYYPLVFCFLKDKSAATYIRMLNNILNLTGINDIT